MFICFLIPLTGNIETGSARPGVLSRNVGLRNELDLFVNVLHAKSHPGINSRHRDIDIFIVRQNTEGEYAMLEHEVYMKLKWTDDFLLNFKQQISCKLSFFLLF